MLLRRRGIDTILIPAENEKDLAEIPANIKRNLTIVPVEHMDDVLSHALVLQDPSEFLKEGTHEVDDILEGVPPQRAEVELPTHPGVN